MKTRILITGANSYIGESFVKYLANWPEHYETQTLDMISDSWHETTFVGFDVILHVAGIVHCKESKVTPALYMRVNRDLAFDVAKKAKNEGVKQFILMSTMAVYGLEGTLRKITVIDENTPENPKTEYGKSKLEAEKLIATLVDDSFIVTILRPPMVYGPGCKGNYAMLEKLVEKNPFYPNIHNQRSVVHIDRLVDALTTYIDKPANEIYFPQDDEYMNTIDTIRYLAEKDMRKVYFLSLLNPVIRFLGFFSPIPAKAFGNLVYRVIDKTLIKGVHHANTD